VCNPALAHVFPLSNHQSVAGVHESLSEAKLRVLDITADAAATSATTPATHAVGDQRNVSQHAAEKQRAKWPPPEFFRLGHRSSPRAEREIIIWNFDNVQKAYATRGYEARFPRGRGEHARHY
jgi:hypothetical protein